MPRAPRLYAPEATVPVVDRCNHREFSCTTPEDLAAVLGKLRGMVRDYELTLYAYTVMSNHVHPLLQAPRTGTLARPLRWVLTETARAFHRARGRRGHCWAPRYRACRVADDPDARGTPNSLGTFHPSYLGLGREAASRHRA